MDNQFSLIKDVEKRSTAISAIFDRSFQTEVINFADEYKMKYLVLTPSAREKYDININSNDSFSSKALFSRLYI